MTPSEKEGRRRGLLLVVSSPSGAGKTSLCARLVADHPALALSVSVTTRSPRAGEQDGREYSFVDTPAFEAMVAQGAFLEWAEVHEHRYGTPRATVMARVEQGGDVLFDIDWQGARSIRRQAPSDTVGVFILPPTMAELSLRLHRRAQDQEPVIHRRLKGARAEISRWADYDYVIVNRDLELAYMELAAIYRAERAKRIRNLWIGPFARDLIEEAE